MVATLLIDYYATTLFIDCCATTLFIDCCAATLFIDCCAATLLTGYYRPGSGWAPAGSFYIDAFPQKIPLFHNSYVYLSLFGKLFETVADEAVKIPSITSLSKLTASALSLPPDASVTASRLFKRSDMYLLY